MENQKFNIISAQSHIDWTGRKVTGTHHGTIAVKGGELIFNDGKLTGGKFIIDTTSIKVTDLTDSAINAQLVGHLSSEDFFSSEKYPEAVFVITNVTGNYIEGDLTIKDITHAVFFEAAVNLNGNVLTATGKLTVDRTKYEMKFRSGNFFKDLGDTLIFNDFDVIVSITAEAVSA
ncbi:MAG: lipid-binding protein [Bacteroidota bacterium]|nr:lipid-binding protein [Bacteroidota bacterium]